MNFQTGEEVAFKEKDPLETNLYQVAKYNSNLSRPKIIFHHHVIKITT